MPFKKILVPTDFSDNSRDALDYAVQLAEKFDASILLLHVQTTADMVPMGIDGMEAVSEAYANLLANYEREAMNTMKAALAPFEGRCAGATCELVSGVPYHAILEVAAEQHADLIVMGTHGRGLIKRFLLGSQADRVVRGASCPVMTVRQRNVD